MVSFGKALVAVDLGAQSCRVSLLRWKNGIPEVRLVHRFPNAPVPSETGLCWNIARIFAGVEAGLRFKDLHRLSAVVQRKRAQAMEAAILRLIAACRGVGWRA